MTARPECFLVAVLLLIGCVTVTTQPLPSYRTKKEFLEVYKSGPDEVIQRAQDKPLKYGSDEMWVIKGVSTEWRYYFKEEELLAVDRVIYETW